MNLLSRFGGRIWDPWREMSQLQHEMNRLFTGVRGHSGVGPGEYPPVNLYVNEHNLLVTLELPGIDPGKVDVTVTGDVLTVTAERATSAVESGDGFHRRERPMGQFKRSVQLPFEVDPSQTEAEYLRGVLTIRMSRPESLKPRKVAVKTA